jgi:hypothetical protein
MYTTFYLKTLKEKEAWEDNIKMETLDVRVWTGFNQI